MADDIEDQLLDQARDGAGEVAEGLAEGGSIEDIAESAGASAAQQAAEYGVQQAAQQGVPVGELGEAASELARAAADGELEGAARAAAAIATNVAAEASSSGVGSSIPEVRSAGSMAERAAEAASSVVDMLAGDEIIAKVAYYVTVVDGPDAEWQLRRLHLREALSEPYVAVMDIVTDELSADTDALLGASCELTIHRGEVVRTIDGLIHQVEYIGVLHDRLEVRVEMVPAFYLLRQRVDTRLWQDASVPEVVEEVLADALDDYQREVDASGLTASYPKRTYIVQYHESDLDFVSRLLEEEGITYRFDHEREEAREVLVLEDSVDNYLDVETVDDNPELHVHAERPEEASVETVQQLDWIRELSSTAIYQRTFDWMTPVAPVESDVGAADTDERGWAREVYHHGRFVEDDPQPRTIRKLDYRKRRDKIARGVANVTGLYPGRKFTLADHERPDLNQEYLVRSAVHTADCAEVMAGGQPMGPRYQCRFECIVFDPNTIPWPVPDTPRPRIYGPQTAIVTGPDGEEIHTDEHGRIKVRFDWDRIRELSDDTSMWIRVAHNWAGPGFGTFFVPRIGMEVVVEFLEGDPAKPIVTGCVYNGDNAISVGLPDNKTQSTIRTRSSPGSEGYNELRFEDAVGSEEIFVHAQKDYNEVVENCHSTSVGADQSNSVSGNQTNSVSKDQTESVTGDQTMSVDGKRTKTVTGDESNTLEANRSTQVHGDELLEVIGTTTTVSGKKVTLQCREDYEQSVGGASSISVNAGPAGPGDGSISAANNFEIRATTKFAVSQGGGAATIVLEGGGASHGTSKKFNVSADSDLMLSSGTKLLAAGASKVQISQGGAVVTLEGGKVSISASEITLSAGGSTIKVDGSGVAISGAKVDVAASGVASVTGAMVKVN
ncbi:type VI secretion system tip protein VgrG [Pseudenhygromyxa sp. WMMC2535]|uniref:type VI secretion system Vgr family protein n=1 Tax=Pseudenhygromyxa sp. WMMC2535 TaxID=2712867 RepID=UPI00155312D0|nr:type VI secretion system tip protein TssI/VgrG [Pseudenhygromyxa sp. WMMC2535]NVB42383.1 type VI secretion system tip protein VgrG [Pseudenhygromyxa sp. WMMC2535]